MTRDKAVDLIMMRLGQRTDTAFRDKIIAEMVSAQEDVLEQMPELPWFLYSIDASLATVIGTATVTLPTDFLLEYEDGALWWTNASGTKAILPKEDWDMLSNTYQGSGELRGYAILGDNLKFAYTPDAVYALELEYYARATDISGSYGDANNIENAWLKNAGDLVIAETGLVLASTYTKSQVHAAYFEKQRLIATNRLIAKMTAIQEANKQQYVEG